MDDRNIKSRIIEKKEYYWKCPQCGKEISQINKHDVIMNRLIHLNNCGSEVNNPIKNHGGDCNG